MNARAYYNEIDPYCAQWLRNLIVGGHIAPGDVDERSIVDVRGDDLRGYTQCHFFGGIGGWSLALRRHGWPDDRPVWTGSCPCQPFSAAGKRKGFADERHLWPVWFDLIRQRRPAIVFGEQVASAAEWLRLVRSDLEAVEYAVGTMPVEAASAGADHLRDRFWFVGHDTRIGRREGRPEHEVRSGRDAAAGTGGAIDVADTAGDGERWQRQPGEGGRSQVSVGGLRSGSDDMAHAVSGGCVGTEQRDLSSVQDQGGSKQWLFERSGDDEGRFDWVSGADGKARRVKSGIRILAHGIPARVAKLRAIGNAIDPRPAAAFIAAATEAMTP